jgi:hypothetical protein
MVNVRLWHNVRKNINKSNQLHNWFNLFVEVHNKELQINWNRIVLDVCFGKYI